MGTGESDSDRDPGGDDAEADGDGERERTERRRALREAIERSEAERPDDAGTIDPDEESDPPEHERLDLE